MTHQKIMTASGAAEQKGHFSKHWKNYLYLLPAVLFIGIFFITSIAYTINLSLFEADGFSQPVYVGLENYKTLVNDPNFRTSVVNTIVWVASSFVISSIVPLVLAILVSNSSRPTGFKNIFYFPSAVSGTVGGIIIGAMMSAYGIPQLLGLMGFEHLVKDWMTVPYVNTALMILSGVWQGVGLNLILYIVGLNNMDASPIEAAAIEGANTWQMYTRVVLPLLRPTFIVVSLMCFVNSFKVFDTIWVMTKGGPYRSSETLALTMYIETFVRNNIGLGSAVAVVLSVVIMIVSFFNLRSTFKEAH